MMICLRTPKGCQVHRKRREMMQEIPYRGIARILNFLKRAQVKAGYLLTGRVISKVFPVAKMLAKTPPRALAT